MCNFPYSPSPRHECHEKKQSASSTATFRQQTKAAGLLDTQPCRYAVSPMGRINFSYLLLEPVVATAYRRLPAGLFHPSTRPQEPAPW